MEFIVKDKCNNCPFYKTSYDSTYVSTKERVTSSCNLMTILPEYDSPIILFHDDLDKTIHIPSNCPLGNGGFKVSLSI